jgi:hypothetical protein
VFCSKPTAGASKQIMPPFLSSPLLSSGGPASAMPAPCLAPNPKRQKRGFAGANKHK